jgi:hypothetical protein
MKKTLVIYYSKFSVMLYCSALYFGSLCLACMTKIAKGDSESQLLQPKSLEKSMGEF